MCLKNDQRKWGGKVGLEGTHKKEGRIFSQFFQRQKVSNYLFKYFILLIFNLPIYSLVQLIFAKCHILYQILCSAFM